ncbi:MAG: ABC transporter ATP-binding protein/permease [Treponema sp.]|nr:ABC transporter ATP-binding protein/permease [Treponema sp.]
MNNKKSPVKRSLAYLSKLAWKHRPRVYIWYVIAFLCNLLQKVRFVVLPKFIFDELMLMVESASREAHLKNIIFYVGLTLGLELFTNLLNKVDNIKMVDQVYLDQVMKLQISDKSIMMDFEHTEDPAVLDQLNRAREGIDWYSGGFTGIFDQILSIISNLFIALGVFTLLVLKCPMLLPVQLVAMVISIIMVHKNNLIELSFFSKLAKDNRVFGYYFWNVADPQFGKDIRLYDAANMLSVKSDVYLDGQINNTKKRINKQLPRVFVMNLVDVLRNAVSYVYIAFRAIKGFLTVGDITLCLNSVSTAYDSIRGMIMGVQEVNKRCKYFSQFLTFMDLPNAHLYGNTPVQEGDHEIEFRDVSFKYPRSEEFVLEHVNITIKSGEHLSVVGLNGAGKTTFIKLLCRLYDVTSGQILIDGINIKEYSDEEYKKLFAVLFQDFKLFAFAFRENITLSDSEYPLGDDQKAIIEKIVTQAGLKEDVKKLKLGLETPVFKSYDKDGTELSGGQQQKTAISRALYKDAPIVILDEPTAALDPVAEYEIYRQFNTLVGGKTAVYISHRLSSCKFCDRIAVFADHTIKEYGTHEELVKLENGIYSRMFNEQAKYYR